MQSLEIKISRKTDLVFIAKITNYLFCLFKACYAYVDSDYNGDSHTPGRSIQDCLGGFSWLNMFGKPYIDLWSKDKMLNAPAYKVEDFSEFVSIMLMENPFYTNEIGKAESLKLKEYFGLDYFYKEALEHRRTIFKSIDEISEYDLETKKLASYLAPDFHKYYDYKSNSKCMFLVQNEKGTFEKHYRD